MSNITMREMLEAGVHFGHQSRYWNPKMSPYLFGQRNKIHIINLEKSLPMYRDAMNFIGNLVAKKGTIMFVGTKRGAQNVIQDEASRCGMPFVNRRWMGGLLTNYKTVKQSIKRMKDLESSEVSSTVDKMSKKEQLQRQRYLNKLSQGLAGIRHMEKLPDALFIIDVGYENIAVSEAKKLGIPVVAVVDSNNNPDNVDYVIPGNDDAVRSIRLYTKGVADAILDARAALSEANISDGEDFIEVDEFGKPIAKEVISKVIIKQKTKSNQKIVSKDIPVDHKEEDHKEEGHKEEDHKEEDHKEEDHKEDLQATQSDIGEKLQASNTDPIERVMERGSWIYCHGDGAAWLKTATARMAEMKETDHVFKKHRGGTSILNITELGQQVKLQGARGAYIKAMKLLDGKSVQYIGELFESWHPPSTPSRGEYAESVEPLSGWIRWLNNNKYITIMEVQE